MTGGVAVLARLEIGQGEVEPHPGQIGVAGDHGAEASDGLLPFAPLGRDRAVQEVEIVDIALARPDAIQQELGVVQLVLGERGPGGLDQGLGGQLRARLRLRRTGRATAENAINQRQQHRAYRMVHSGVPAHYGIQFECVFGKKTAPDPLLDRKKAPGPLLERQVVRL